MVSGCKKLLHIPNKVPEQALDIEYSYFYRQTLDDEVKMTLAYTLEEEEFEKERKRIEDTYLIVSEERIENTDFYFTAVSERVIFVAFDEDRHRILYGYLANMGQDMPYRQSCPYFVSAMQAFILHKFYISTHLHFTLLL